MIQPVKKRFTLVFFFLFVVLLFSAACVPKDSQGESEELSLKSIWNAILSVGKLEFLFPEGKESGETAISALARIAVFIIIFALLFEIATRALPVSRNIAGVITFVLAAMSAIFMPAAVLISIFATYSLLFSLILVGVVVVGAAYFVYHVLPGGGAFWLGIRVLILLGITIALYALRSHISKLLGP